MSEYVPCRVLEILILLLVNSSGEQKCKSISEAQIVLEAPALESASFIFCTV